MARSTPSPFPFHEILKAEREAAGKKQREMAEAMLMDPGHYHRLENGTSGYYLHHAYRAAKFLGVPIARLVGEEDAKQAA